MPNKKLKSQFTKTVGMTTNSQQKHHKIVLQASRSHGIELGRKIMQETSRKQTTYTLRKKQIGAHILYQL